MKIRTTAAVIVGVTALAATTLTSAALATPPDAALAERGCAALASRVDAIAGTGPVFLASYEQTNSPALTGAAFVYDNALAAIALTACGRHPQANRIAQALALAATHDRADTSQARLRNVYRAGPQTTPPPPHGWWDPTRRQWMEDSYQTGTATGNVAWAGLALLTVARGGNDPSLIPAARHLGKWVLDHMNDGKSGGGYAGGIHGDGAAAHPVGWKSTEHNIDLAALFGWMARLDGGNAPWTAAADQARAFVDWAWISGGGHFLTGTLPDGVTPNRATSGLDAQFWPQLLDSAPGQWAAALDYAQSKHGVAGGFDFNDDRDGLWVEGTAQGALALWAVKRPQPARALLAGLSQFQSPTGLWWASREDRITTGLAIGPDSTTADFFYFRIPHLGATAWVVLAGLGWNPMTGAIIAE